MSKSHQTSTCNNSAHQEGVSDDPTRCTPACAKFEKRADALGWAELGELEISWGDGPAGPAERDGHVDLRVAWISPVSLPVA